MNFGIATPPDEAAAEDPSDELEAEPDPAEPRTIYPMATPKTSAMTASM